MCFKRFYVFFAIKIYKYGPNWGRSFKKLGHFSRIECKTKLK